MSKHRTIIFFIKSKRIIDFYDITRISAEAITVIFAEIKQKIFVRQVIQIYLTNLSISKDLRFKLY